MSENKRPPSAKVSASKASVKSHISASKQPNSGQANPMDAISRCGYGSRTEGKRSGLQPIEGDYVPYYDRIYKPSSTPAVDTTRPAGISSFPHLKRQQELEQQQQAQQLQNQQHNVAEPAAQQVQHGQNQEPPQGQQSGDCVSPRTEVNSGANANQELKQSPHEAHATIPNPHEYVTKCPNCAATLVLTPQMMPCTQNQQ